VQDVARGKTIAVLGLTFKPNTDDMRDSPAISVIAALQDSGARIKAFDPEGMAQARLVLENLTYCGDAYAHCEGAAALVIVTEWDEFRALDLARVKTLLAAPVVVDLRNIYDPAELQKHGLAYVSVGRG
jgi:UDPglucose 6-dehydrogenase